MAKSLKTVLITPKIKYKVHCNLQENKNFRIENLFSFETDKNNITDILSEIPLNTIFVKMKELNVPYKCILFKTNKAWISEDEAHHQRYFTKSRKGILYSFDILDILEFYYNKPISQIFNLLSDKFKIYFEDNWSKDNEYKYYQNYDKLLGLKIEKEFPHLKNQILKHIDLIHKINDLARENIRTENFTYKDQNIFFFSNQYMINHSEYQSKSTINKLINMFCFLGLLEKVPKNFINNIPAFSKTKKVGLNPITFYIVPKYTNELFSKADKKAEYLINNKIKYYKLTTSDYKNLSVKFNISDISYGENKNPHKQSPISNAINLEFKAMLNEYNFVSKELIINKTHCSKKTIDAKWMTLIRKYGLISKRPTNKEKIKYNLKTNLNIGITNRSDFFEKRTESKEL